jgi:hypothetical protein
MPPLAAAGRVLHRDCEKSAGSDLQSRCIPAQKRLKVTKLLNFTQNLVKLSGGKLSRSAPGGRAKLAQIPAKPGSCRLWRQPGAFCTGIVKNQHIPCKIIPCVL